MYHRWKFSSLHEAAVIDDQKCTPLAYNETFPPTLDVDFLLNQSTGFNNLFTVIMSFY